MAEPVEELKLSDYVDIFRRRWVVIVLVSLVTLGIAVAAAALETPRFRAEARVLVESASNGELGAASSLSSNIRDRNLSNEVEFARSDRVSRAASESLGTEHQISISAGNGSDTLVFSAVSIDPARAADVANTFADSYVSERGSALLERLSNNERIINERLEEIAAERRDVQTRLSANPDDPALISQMLNIDSEESSRRAQLTELGIISQFNQTSPLAKLNAAQVPGSAFSPSLIRNIALGLVAGVILGIGFALLLETLDDTILTKRDLETATDFIPVLGVIPPPWKGRRGRERRLVVSKAGAFTEAFRGLRSAIELGQRSGEEIRSILVTSASPAEGKSTVAAHLALSFARAGERVLVIDADMHNPTQHLFFEVENVNGFADHLSNVDEAEIVVERASGDGLVSLIPAGTSASSPAELLSSLRAQELIVKLAAAYDLVIIDSPPLRPVSDTLPLARIADAILLVGRRGFSNDHHVEHGMELLAQAQAVPLGSVLVGVDVSYTGYGSGYGEAIKSRRVV